MPTLDTVVTRQRGGLAGAWLLAALIVLLAGCTTSTDVVLRNPTTGQTVACPGEYAPGGIPSVARMRAVEDQTDCVWRLQKRGFEAQVGG